MSTLHMQKSTTFFCSNLQKTAGITADNCSMHARKCCFSREIVWTMEIKAPESDRQKSLTTNRRHNKKDSKLHGRVIVERSHSRTLSIHSPSLSFGSSRVSATASVASELFSSYIVANCDYMHKDTQCIKVCVCVCACFHATDLACLHCDFVPPSAHTPSKCQYLPIC